MEETYHQRDHLEYPDATLTDLIEKIALQYPDEPAYEFYGRKTSFSNFVKWIHRAARAFLSAGIGRDDVVTICMPNVPQAIDCFYALNRIGAVANMVHPLSAQKEISYFLEVSESKMILTVDMFTEKVEAALTEVHHPVTVLVCRMQEELPPHLALLYLLKAGRPYLKFPNTDHALLWSAFLKEGGSEPLPPSVFDPGHTSVILYSGGTSGPPKGICLSDRNINACAMQAREAIGEEFRCGLKMLACMPIFHGFGLGINIHTVLMHGACCVLMPTFNNKTYARALIKKKPNFLAGVPTIFEALLHLPELNGVDLSFLMGMFCGGDSLSVELKKKMDTFLQEHGARIQIREGYGLTECVTASCLTPKGTFREGSIGLPFPDTSYAIVRPGSADFLPPGEEGEIILSGPSVMLGYLNRPEETAEAIRELDGTRWLYTGDLGHMDEDGYVYFHQRLKRMIITNGYNIYPGQIENILDGLPEISYSCVIGVPDPRRGQRIKAYIVLKDGVNECEEVKENILRNLRLHVARYAMPREIEFRRELPKTLVGKVAWRLLEEEEQQKQEGGAAHEPA